MWIIDWVAIASWAQVVVVAFGFLFAYKQLKLQANDAKGRTALDLRLQFLQYINITSNLVPGGKWEDGIPSGKETNELINHYLGLFEHCEYLIRLGVMDIDFFCVSHLPKLNNAVCNEYIKSNILDNAQNWGMLFDLCNRPQIKLMEVFNTNPADNSVITSMNKFLEKS